MSLLIVSASAAAASMDDAAAAVAHADRRADDERPSWLAHLCMLMSVPSVSSDPARRADVLEAATMTERLMTEAGLENVETSHFPAGGPGHAVVYGDWLHAPPGAPTVLVYNHFDVQPEDPVEGWREGHRAFPGAMDECVKDGLVMGRGASDNKGGLVGVLAAVSAVMNATGGLPVNVKFIAEGQEEIGSPGMADWMRKHAEKVRCDLAFSGDGGTKSETAGLLTLGLRGGTDIEITVDGPDVDVHSGMYGGGINNPIHALVAIIASMRSSEGTITVPGFLDKVRAVPAAERARLNADAISEEDFLREAGNAPGAFGEPGFTTAERVGVRPTLEVVGMWGGYQGPGTKTIVPARAVAKLVARLVPHQVPEEINALLQRHVEAVAPPGVTVSVTTHGWNHAAFLSSVDSPSNRVAARVLGDVYADVKGEGSSPAEHAPTVRYEGGSIPVVKHIEALTGTAPAILAFGLGTDRVHSPNEIFPVKRFALVTRAYVRVMFEAARMHRAAAAEKVEL